jgi:DNA-directed RNA polymerase subunit A"
MLNAGTDCCGYCRFNQAVQERDIPSYDRREEFRRISFCILRDIKITDPFKTYCKNFQYGNRTPDPLHKVKIDRWIFINGLNEGDVKIPWNGIIKPNVSAPCICFLCGRKTETGITVIEDSKEIGFCTNRHYIYWWKTKYDDPTITTKDLQSPEEFYKEEISSFKKLHSRDNLKTIEIESNEKIEEKKEPERTFVPPPTKKEEETKEYKTIRAEINKLLKNQYLPISIIDGIVERAARDKKIEGKIKNIIEKALAEYAKNRIDPTEACGMISAQSIGQGSTEMCMGTYHHAESSNFNVSFGLQHLIEIMDVKRCPSTPVMNIYLRDEYRINPDLAKEIANKIEITRLTDVADIEMDLVNIYISIKPNKKTIVKKGITLEDLLERIQSVRKISAKIEKENIKVTLDEPGYKILQNANETLKNLKIKGIDGIKRVIIRKEPNEGYVVYSEGSNLKEVLDVEGVDPYRTTTNNIYEINKELGIEAARNMIIQEMYSTLSEQGINIDMRHIMLVADMMTTDGILRPIGRIDFCDKKSSNIKCGEFEVTIDHLFQASQRREADEINGIRENMIVGQTVNFGTGAIELIMSPKKPKQNAFIKNPNAFL